MRFGILWIRVFKGNSFLEENVAKALPCLWEVPFSLLQQQMLRTRVV